MAATFTVLFLRCRKFQNQTIGIRGRRHQVDACGRYAERYQRVAQLLGETVIQFAAGVANAQQPGIIPVEHAQKVAERLVRGKCLGAARWRPLCCRERQ